jgi:hypothetical protein
MINLEDEVLKFSFPQAHASARFLLDFQRTLRIPDDAETHYLPPGLGKFPLRHVDDLASALPPAIGRRGGVALPMHSSEAMWINFRGGDAGEGLRYPFAVKIAAGKINAVTGLPWREGLSSDLQDYIVVPEQPWLDGFSIGEGIIRQFVAERLGEGYSVEEQLTGRAEFGGLQIIAYPMKAARYEDLRRRRLIKSKLSGVLSEIHWERQRLRQTQRDLDDMQGSLEAVDIENAGDLDAIERLIDQSQSRLESLRRGFDESSDSGPRFSRRSASAREWASGPTTSYRSEVMGLAAGGRMKQEIYADPYGIDAWDQTISSRCFVTLLTADMWAQATGEAPPTEPLAASDYAKSGLPWFDYYKPSLSALGGSSILAKVKSWAHLKNANGEAPDNQAPAPATVIPLGGSRRPTTNVVREVDI